MLRSHQIRLQPNNKQATYLARAVGVARFAYNWGLVEWKKQYEAWKADNNSIKPSQHALRRQLNAIKREQFPWMLEVTKNAPQMALIQLGEAYKNFFAGRARFPKFRKKGIKDRFALTNDQFNVEENRIHIPKLGWVRMREPLRFNGKIMSANVSRIADHWYVSISVDTSLSHRPAENQGIVGVDLGVSALATLSSGESVAGAKPHSLLLNRLRRLSRSLCRKQKGSNNRNKVKKKLARLHARIKNIRTDALHKLTTHLVRTYRTICIEDLNVKGMVKNHCLARAVSDMGFGEFRRQLTYKTETYDGNLIVADRWFASSKLCSHCGHKKESLALSTRTWVCSSCNTKHDRDLNAAINLKLYAVSSTVSACGEEVKIFLMF
jgi:putative transposase